MRDEESNEKAVSNVVLLTVRKLPTVICRPCWPIVPVRDGVCTGLYEREGRRERERERERERIV